MKKGNRIRLFDSLIGALLAASAVRALISGVHNLRWVLTELFAYGYLQEISQDPSAAAFPVRVLIQALLALACGVLAAIGFVWRRPGKHYRNSGILFIVLGLWIALWHILEVVLWATAKRAVGWGTLTEWMFSGAELSLALLGFCLLDIAWGILLIVYGKKLLPAWLEQGALVAFGPLPFLRELGMSIPGLWRGLKRAWLDMRERNRMP